MQYPSSQMATYRHTSFVDSGRLDFVGDAGLAAGLAEIVQSATDSIERTNSFGFAMMVEIALSSSLQFPDVPLRLLWFIRDYCAHGAHYGVFLNAASDGVNHLGSVR